jgi:hypothetical protein
VREEPGSTLSGAAGAGGAAGVSSQDGMLLTDGPAAAGGIPTGGIAVA